MEQRNNGATERCRRRCSKVLLFHYSRIFMKTKISELRKKIGMTQEELAEKAGVTRQTIISLEAGRYNPSLLLAHNITAVLKQKQIEDVFSIK
jgi:putative transcriptional regulator